MTISSIRLQSIVIVLSLLILGGCSSSVKFQKTLGEEFSNYSYIPLDPLPIKVQKSTSCIKENEQDSSTSTKLSVLDFLPDQANHHDYFGYHVDDVLCGGHCGENTDG